MSPHPETNGVVRPTTPPSGRKLAGAPISWGVCEVPGWGRMLPPERVLTEMAALGLRATEMGPVGYLPADTDEVRDLLSRYGLGVVGAFVPLVLHEPDLAQATTVIEQVLPALTALDGETLVA